MLALDEDVTIYIKSQLPLRKKPKFQIFLGYPDSLSKPQLVSLYNVLPVLASDISFNLYVLSKKCAKCDT